MEKPLITGTDLAEALGVSGAALSMAVREDRPCKDRPVQRWAKRGEKSGGEEGPVRGYAVPRPVRIELGLPPFEGLSKGDPPSVGDSPPEERSSPKELDEEVLREVTRWYITKLAARVAFSIHEEMGPWLREAIRARIEAGEWPPEWAETDTEGKVAEDQEAGHGEIEEGSAAGAEEGGGFDVDILGSILAAGLGDDSPAEGPSEEDTSEEGASEDGTPDDGSLADGPSGDGERG